MNIYQTLRKSYMLRRLKEIEKINLFYFTIKRKVSIWYWFLQEKPHVNRNLPKQLSRKYPFYNSALPRGITMQPLPGIMDISNP